MVSWGHGWQRAGLSQLYPNWLRNAHLQPEIWEPAFLCEAALSFLAIKKETTANTSPSLSALVSHNFTQNHLGYIGQEALIVHF